MHARLRQLLVGASVHSGRRGCFGCRLRLPKTTSEASVFAGNRQAPEQSRTLPLRARLLEDSGQIAITAVLAFLVIFTVAALALDAGIWYFDHRWAQNQSEAAALAGVLELPSKTTTNATARANQWL